MTESHSNPIAPVLPPNLLMDPGYVYELSSGCTLHARSPVTSDVYGFGVAFGTDDEQEQKWILFTKRPEHRPPTRPRMLRRAQRFQAPSGHFWDDVTRFDENVRSAFVEEKYPDGHYYVKVTSRRCSNQDDLPGFVRPPSSGGGRVGIFQPDIGTAQLSHAGQVTGLLAVMGQVGAATTEHWLLSARYSNAAENVIERVSGEQLLEMVRRQTWDRTWTLVSCACEYYESRRVLPLTQLVAIY